VINIILVVDAFIIMIIFLDSNLSYDDMGKITLVSAEKINFKGYFKMKKSILIISVVILTVCCYISLNAQSQSQILSTIKKIDNNMSKGKISYTENQNKYDIVYSGNKYFIYYKLADSKCADASDGKNYFFISYAGPHGNLDHVTISDKEGSNYTADSRIVYSIAPKASFGEGRGLSVLSNPRIDKKDGKIILTGYLSDNISKIVAELNPKYDFLADKIYRYTEDGIIGSTWICGVPKKVDGIYIATKSTYEINLEKLKDINYYEIKSASFKAPPEDELKVDWAKCSLIRDTRFGKEHTVNYDKEDLPNNITLDELYKLSKRKLEEDVYIPVISCLIFIILIFFILKRIKQLRKNKPRK